jgi:voltage-gated potassium channel
MSPSRPRLPRPRPIEAPAPAPARRGELLPLRRRIVWLGALVAGLLAFGTIGLALSEGVGPWYALRWTLDTLSTIGGFPQPRTAAGQVIDVLLVVLGVGTLFYALATVTEFFVAGHLGELLAMRRAQKMIDSLTDHHIICGYGRVGRQVARDLDAAGAPYVVVDAGVVERHASIPAAARLIEGDAADDSVLLAAGIERAASVLVCADSDAQNIFITLTARELRSDIAIVARAAAEDSEKKLRRAGADRVISPYKASGAEIARLALHPQIRGVLDVDSDYRLDEIAVIEGCPGAHRTIADIGSGAMIVGLRRDGRFSPQPPLDTVLVPGDAFIVMGTTIALERLERLFDVAARRSASGVPSAGAGAAS